MDVLHLATWASRSADAGSPSAVAWPLALTVAVGALLVCLWLLRRTRRRLSELSTVTEGAEEPMFLKDRDGRYVYMNRAGAAVLGRSPEEVVGRDDFALFDPTEAREIRAADGDILQARRPSRTEGRRNYAGVERVLQTTKVPYLNRTGAQAGILGISHDVTSERARMEELERECGALEANAVERTAMLEREVEERRRTERSLRKREHQLRRLSELTADCCWVRREHAGKSQRTWLTGSIERLTGYTPAEFESLGRAGIVHPEDLPEALRHVNGPLGTSESEFRIVTKAGEVRWLHECMHVEAQGDGTLFVYGATHDVTARKDAEEALRKSTESLHQAQKMEALGQLAGGIVHDFNNLLMVIGGCGEVLVSRLGDAPELTRLTTEIQHATDRAAGLASQLLAFSRKHSADHRLLELNEVVREAVDMLSRLLPESVVIELDLDPWTGLVRADPGNMEQVLVNLVINARDALPDGGTIRIETRRVPATPDRAVSVALLRVVDDGIGMDSETRARLFEPFFTTKPSGEGTGLGLAVVYGIVTQSAGTIRVESERGKGTTFEVALPTVPG